MKLAPKIKLNSGYEMPILGLGLGTYDSKDKDMELAVKHAIDCGYRQFDTAYFYQNETEVGKAIKAKIEEGVITREEVFVTTKLWNIHHAPDKVEYACRKSLANLGMDYIDMYLMHVPVGFAYVDDKTFKPLDSNGNIILSDVDYLDTYRAMEKLVKAGLVRSIGVSNFNSEQIDRVLENCEIRPVVNQVECHPVLNQKKLTKFCKERDIVVIAYCPLGRPNPVDKTPAFLYSNKIQSITDKYKKSVTQIILRYLIDIGTIPIPKSTNKDRIKANFDVFDFKLDAEDIAMMDEFNTGQRLITFPPIKIQNHKYYPFNGDY